MGLIKAAIGSFGGVMADQWKEFFYCEALPEDVMMVKGKKKTSSRSSNTKGEADIISNGSGISVNEGQCAILVDQGKIVDICAVPGEYTWDKSTEPSLFTGSLGKSILETFKTVGRRFTFGGDTGKDQRVYYFNTKELMNNKFGTPNPIPFRAVDTKIGLDIDVSVRCSGVFSYKIDDPILFYANVCGNAAEEYRRSTIDPQLKTEFISALSPAIAGLSDLEIRPNQISKYPERIANDLNVILSQNWGNLRGLKVVSIAFNPITLPEEDAELIKQHQSAAVMRNPSMAAATLVQAQAQAMKDAAKNPNGSMMGFMGMGMAQQKGGMNAENLYAMGQQQMQQQMQQQQMQQQMPQQMPQQQMPQQQMPQQQMPQQQMPQQQMPQQASPAPANGWQCVCGATATGKFCPECGKPKPVASDNGWTCSCGAVNKGKFCSECGNPKPAGVPQYRCDKCGWEPEDPANPPKFCPECGDPFNDGDII